MIFFFNDSFFLSLLISLENRNLEPLIFRNYGENPVVYTFRNKYGVNYLYFQG